MKRVLAVCLLVMILIIGISGCGKKTETPSDVIKTAYNLANEGKYSEVEKYFAKEAQTYLKGDGAVLGGIKGICDSTTKNCTLEKLDVKSENIVGEGATVSIEMTFKDKSLVNYDAQLRKEDGSWKMLIK